MPAQCCRLPGADSTHAPKLSIVEKPRLCHVCSSAFAIGLDCHTRICMGRNTNMYIPVCMYSYVFVERALAGKLVQGMKRSLGNHNIWGNGSRASKILLCGFELFTLANKLPQETELLSCHKPASDASVSRRLRQTEL